MVNFDLARMGSSACHLTGLASFPFSFFLSSWISLVAIPIVHHPSITLSIIIVTCSSRQRVLPF
ncbi:hypothetical protein BDV24DRAFT_123678 [Aspergillus arachidicola]|uniref:Uncharacterized protein n=1 Tax=Aspergillus arachidicola TaxID=656916 RepID=A0A5N6YRW4_9EURO|nr:hypothetical protein BDV24DRAFT_123678 [Aspergillus arachidicola]